MKIFISNLLKLGALLCAFALIFTFFSCNETPKDNGKKTDAYSPVEDFEIEINDDDTATILSYIGDDTHVVLPKEYQGYPIRAVWEKAFYRSRNVESIVIGDHILEIADEAFSSCTSLKHVDFGSTEKQLGQNLFNGCTALTEMKLPEWLRSVPKGMFLGCTSLQSVTLHDKIVKIEAYAFSGCISLDSISIPESCVTIGYLAFEDCQALQRISLPQGNNVTEGCFGYCFSLKEINLPSDIEAIYDNGFQYCVALSHIELPDGIQGVGYRGFYFCLSLTRISVPKSVTILGKEAFCYTNLSDIDYDGTMEEWKAIQKGDNFDENLTYTVHCSDGDIFVDN